jgi:endonuclease/exonuclease/phosphatase family metal-dependent hydrolase
MVHDLHARMSGYSWIGVGRDDGGSEGELNPIFYRTDRLALLEHNTFWLAAECSTPARGWDAYCRRIVTWARFMDLTSRSEFFHFNTHFDHFGRKARRESARLLLAQISSIAGEAPVVVTGDFNCREKSATYRSLTTGADKEGKYAGQGLRDSFYVAAQRSHRPKKTWRGLPAGGLGSARIDYIFVNNRVSVRAYAVIADKEPGCRASDHLPIIADVEIELAAAKTPTA